MRLGTRSVLAGAHCFFLHPLFVAWAWWRLYGFPLDIRLWASFFLHDVGYLGKPNMDGPEGVMHPEVGADLMGLMFGEEWYQFTLYHSRSYSAKAGMNISKLCVADKLAFALTPKWLYLPMVTFTGEIHEYMDNAKRRNGSVSHESPGKWHDTLKVKMLDWVACNK